MNDRYLFKAKRIDNGEWVIGLLTKMWGQLHIINPDDENTAYPIDEDIICQCTGLKDKNGTLIWENDVVTKHFYTDYDAYANSEKYTGIVKFLDCAWVIETKRNNVTCERPIFESLNYSHDAEYFEVIGSMIDNPELLEVK